METMKDKIQEKINFIIIGLVTVVGMGIIPFLTQCMNYENEEEFVKNAFPTNTFGWIAWAILRGMIILINMMLFVAFVNQGKLNVKNEKEFVEANTKWTEVQVYKGRKTGKKSKMYLTPSQHYATIYFKKGLFVSLATFASLFTITYLVLYWDFVTFLSITITIVLCIVFGILTMLKEQAYWTNDFPIRADIEYRKMIEEKKEELQ